MSVPSPYWAIVKSVAEEVVPGATFSVFIGDGEDAETDGFYFEFQRSLRDYPDEQNVRNGADSYCIVNEADGVQYGGLEEVSLTAELLLLRFDDEAVEELELPSNLVPLSIAQGIDIEILRAGLRRVLTYGNPRKVPRINL